VNGSCQDGRLFGVTLIVASLIRPDGATCTSVRPNIPFITWFRVPPSWGGKLSVVWLLNTVTKDRTQIGQEVEAARFDLPGYEDGCQLMTDSGSPFPP
jgi:hypothetical protein